MDESRTVFMRGNLYVRVSRARKLADTDTAFFNLARGDLTDPYVTGDLGTARIFKTRVIDNNLNPEWNESFSIDVCHHADYLHVKVKDKDTIGTDEVGSCHIDLRRLMNGKKERLDDAAAALLGRE